MQAPLVTVLIPAYNHESYVEETIKSVLNQTYKNIQLIVVNDGSTDSTQVVISSLKKCFEFEYIDQNNQGLIKTLNNVVNKHVKGKYFCVLGSDDVYLENKIQTQVEFLERNPEYVACSANVFRINNFGKILPKLSQVNKKASDFSFEDIISANYYFPAPAAMIRFEKLKFVGGYDDDVKIEDLSIWLKLTYAGGKLFLLPDTLAKYRIHGNNMHSNSLEMHNAKMEILNKYKHIPYFNSFKNEWELRNFCSLAKYYKRQAIYLLPNVCSQFMNKKLYIGFLNLLIPQTIRLFVKNYLA